MELYFISKAIKDAGITFDAPIADFHYLSVTNSEPSKQCFPGTRGVSRIAVEIVDRVMCGI
jgi:hypothetical protein